MHLSLTLSVIIITKNEAPVIRRCLESIRWADEIIVLDSGSTDDTVAICKEYTEQVYPTDWPGYGPQKNRALAKASGQWVLSLDADEWIPAALQIEIQSVISHPQPSLDGFFISRKTQYLGQWMRYGDLAKDRVLRLFRRDQAHFKPYIVHESVQVYSGKVGQLTQPLCHESYPNIEKVLDRLNAYTTLSASQRLQQGKKSTVTKALFNAGWAFFRTYLWRLGFLDGKIGFIFAICSAENSFYRHVKLTFASKQL
jgi:glycosyltransferase involved in cell wall biosynthesis